MISKRNFLLLITSFLSVEMAHAQYLSANYGTGMWGGMQSCPYNQRSAAGAFNGSDEMRDIRNDVIEKKKELDAKKKEISKYELEVRSAERGMSKTLNSDALTVIKNHFSQDAKCKDYFGSSDESEKSKTCIKKDGEEICPSPDANVDALTYDPYTKEEWKSLCKPAVLDDAGKIVENKKISNQVCDVKHVWVNKYGNSSSCKESLGKYSSSLRAREKAKAEKASIENDLKGLAESFKIAQDQYQEDLQNGDQSQTQAEYCASCNSGNSGYSYEAPRTDWGATLINVGLGLASMYGNYRANKMVAEYNSNLGYPTQQNYMGYVPGAMTVMNGVYGAVAGGTSYGAFGCSGGPNGNGNWNGALGMNSPFPQGGLYNPGQGNMWGYPQGMYNPMSGGMYNAGLAPWMVGPNAGLNISGGLGLNGAFNPYGNAGLGVNGAFNPYGNAGLGVNGALNPLAGAGLNITAGLGFNPYANGALGVNGAFNPYGNAGLGVNGAFNPYGNGTGVDLGAAQYQQQMLQMQLQAQQQQAQMYLQQQQQAAQQYQQNLQIQIQRQQAAAEVQMQMQQLAIKLQQIQAGVGLSASGSGYLSGGLSGSLSGGLNSGVSGGFTSGSGLNFGVGANGSGSSYLNTNNPVINPNGTGTRQSR